MADYNKPLKPAWPAGRYMRYAIGEIALVVIGILIALSLNNIRMRNLLTIKLRMPSMFLIGIMILIWRFSI